jgi:ATP-dependent Clp protease ATP-binding subunit ClpA
MYERFTDHALNAMRVAKQTAKHLNCTMVDTEHILLGLITTSNSVAAAVLKNLDIDLADLRAAVEKQLISFRGALGIIGELPLSDLANTIIEYAGIESKKLNHTYIGTEHILLGVLRLNTGWADYILNSFELTFDKTRKEILNVLNVTAPEELKAAGLSLDSVNHPAHYTRGGYECLNVIEALQLGYHLGNAFKYIWRAGHKNDATEDIKKAIVYLNRWLELQGDR